MSEGEESERSQVSIEQMAKNYEESLSEEIDPENINSLSKLKNNKNAFLNIILVQINRKLKEELSSTFEGYVKMLSKWDILRKEKLDLQ